ncbi:hypothetical protein PLICRDRAFT_106263 [Plicaturopsis crispa FD-325 SS-3]|nr:hypothetical protein PLICRDRAFT_106263 [Plicaturopsis crispa FD-325 SS-3]
MSNADFKFKEGADVFAPKDLVELARPGAGVANDAGDLVLVPLSKYSFEESKNHKSIVIAPLDAKVQSLEIPFTDGGEAFWLDTRTIAHVVAKDKHLDVYTLSLALDADSLRATDSPVLVGSFPTTTATNFRYVPAAGRLIFSDKVHPDGELAGIKPGDEAWTNRGNTALVYDTTYVRHWDTWEGPKQNTLFSVPLAKGSDGKWTVGDTFVNVLKGVPHHAPVEPFGGTDDFHASETHIVYTTKDPVLPEAWHTKQNVYIVPIAGGEAPKELTSGKQGATHGPVFNKQGDKVAWIELDENGYEADRAKIVLYDLTKDVRFTLTRAWDRSAESLEFSPDGTTLYFTAGDYARVKVYSLPVPATPSQSTTHPSLPPQYTQPTALTHTGAAGGIQALPNGRLLFSRSSLTSPNDVFVLRGLAANGTANALQTEQVTKLTEAALKEKALAAGEDIWFKGAGGRDVQGWVLKPKGWVAGETAKWPVVLLIHGGPQGAWEDQWSTRWNPNVFAQQGYFTVAINPTGSTTFGQEFTDAIAEDWGGKPFVDLQAGWEHVLKTFPEVDKDRAVAAGASWGGYAINWIQGHPEFNFGFKALVGHDGVFDSNYNGYSTDELFFFNHEWGGRPWDEKSKKLSEKFSPSNYVSKWSTPQLLIHGSKDYRLPETESIAAFHALQQRGVPSRLVVFPDENHWVLNHGNSLKWHYEVFRWFDAYVGKRD